MSITSHHLYTEILNCSSLPQLITLKDHLGGFDQLGNNSVLEQINQVSNNDNKKISVVYHNVLEHTILSKYPNIDFVFDAQLQYKSNFAELSNYRIHPLLDYKNFICSFNGSPHVSRKLLVAILEKFKYFNSDYCSKNFVHDINTIDGHIFDYVGDANNFYRKFFIGDRSEDFFQTINSFGHVQYDHAQNIYNLEHKLTQSFLHIVSETMATSYYPFVTEKFLYSIVTRGLFLAYAQPGWHAHLEKYYGFQKYTRLFDYRFDTIQNPIERLVEIMTMVSKFSVLSAADWQDLYEMESDTIEFNYNHYFSGDYLKCLAKHSQTV